MIARVSKPLSKVRRVARERKPLEPHSPDLVVRFAIHLRAILDKKKLTSSDLAQRLNAAGLKIDVGGVNTWLRAEGMPKAKDLEVIGQALGLPDYRKILPDPLPS